MTTINVVHTLLKARFPLMLGMEGNPRVSVQGRTEGSRTERVEGVVY